MIYDLIIIGGGPAGLTLAHCCSNIKNLKILVIDRENQIGGCHRVNRVNYNNEKIFTEHGPRIYSSSYKNFDFLLNEMNTSLIKIFKPYNFQLLNSNGQISSSLTSNVSISEMFNIIINFIKLLFNDEYGKDINMKTYLYNNNFSKKTIDVIDRLCRLSDGGGIEKYSLNEFLQLINQQSLYKIYQPNKPTDKELFIIWKRFLEKRNVEFLLNTEINNFIIENNNIKSCIINNQKIEGNKFILAIPPKNIIDIFNKNNNLKNAFGEYNLFKKWVHKTDYIDYISIAYHWDYKLNLKKVYGFPKSDWGVISILLTDYMNFDEKNSKTVISTATIYTDRISKNNNKTANMCDKDELIKEIFKQLKETYIDLPDNYKAFITPNNYYENGEWESKDTAFMATYNTKYIDFKSKNINNLYNLGTQNGKSIYKFTSLESAISNAIYLSIILYPELKEKYTIIPITTVRDIFFYFIIFIIIIIIIILLFNIRIK